MHIEGSVNKKYRIEEGFLDHIRANVFTVQFSISAMLNIECLNIGKLEKINPKQ